MSKFINGVLFLALKEVREVVVASQNKTDDQFFNEKLSFLVRHGMLTAEQAAELAI